MSAPIGNQNARNAREWKDTLKYTLDNFENGAIERGKALREIATKLIEEALDGKMPAIREIADRLDGKPHQAMIELSNNRPIKKLSTAELEAIIQDGIKRNGDDDDIESDK